MKQFPSIKPFQEVYKTAYSHGLEEIYALENVDISTVRPLSSQIHQKTEKPTVNQAKKNHRQPNLDLGLSFKQSMDHFALREPIQVLGLTKYLETSLLGQNKKRLCDLIDLHVKDLIYLKGIGQGHIDEIQLKLNEYLAGRHLEKSLTVDFASWLKGISADIDKKKAFVVLEKYGLSHILTLSSAESLELRRLTLEKRSEWREQAEIALQNEEKRHQVEKDLWEITEVFIKPWMDSRFGIANVFELLERIMQISENSYTNEIWSFFQETYYRGQFPLNRYLVPLDADVFASCGWVADHYDSVIERALTYFCSSSNFYSLDMLVGLIEREMAQSWIGYREGFIVKALKASPRFYLYKNHLGLLHVRLA